MSKVFASIAMSVDGYVAGPDQSLEQPLGGRGAEDHLHRWMFETPEENRAELDAIVDAGAFVMGRNMFGPSRGAWDLDWRGWWGPEPPYHQPVFVLTHHERDDLPMEGGTTFHFVTDGITEALERARAAAGDRPVSVAGGASTLNQFLAAGLVDELTLHVAPVVLGAGERLFEGVPQLRLEQTGGRSASLVTHLHYRVPRPRSSA